MTREDLQPYPFAIDRLLYLGYSPPEIGLGAGMCLQPIGGVRRGHDGADPIPSGYTGHRDGFLTLGGPIIDPREDVAVQVNHLSSLS